MNADTTLPTPAYASLWKDSVPSIAWGTVALFIFVLVGYAVVLSAALLNVLPYPLAALMLGYLAFVSFTVLHDAGHGNIFKMGSPFKPLEEVMGWIASIPLLLVPYRFFQKIHDRHHAFTNDPERDPDYFHGPYTWPKVLVSGFTLPFRYLTMALTQLRHLKLFRSTLPSTFSFAVLVWGGLIGLAMNGYVLEVVSFALVPQVIAMFLLSVFFDIVPHFPHKALGRHHNTNAYGGRWMNLLLLGQNYHLMHHMYPRLPWYKYREVFLRTLPDLKAKGAPIFDSALPDFSPSSNADRFQRNGDFADMVLSVAEVQRLTPSAVTIRFDNPPGPSLRFKAGQYIMISKWLNGAQHTRCYSLCRNPADGVLQVGVRAIGDGLVSNYLNTQLKVGDDLVVQGPFGDFIYPPTVDLEIDELVLVAGGSGITPIKAILESALSHKSIANIHLLYANRSQAEAMFFETLALWQQTHPQRLKITHIFADAPASWAGETGLLDASRITRLLQLSGSANANRAYYMCGPDGLKNVLLATLNSHQVAASRIFVEQFAATAQAPIGEQFPVRVTLADGQSKTLKVASNQTILDVAKAEGLAIPHACCAGTCGTCKMRVVSGKAKPIADTFPGLIPAEKANGITLACQCRPVSPMEIKEGIW